MPRHHTHQRVRVLLECTHRRIHCIGPESYVGVKEHNNVVNCVLRSAPTCMGFAGPAVGQYATFHYFDIDSG